VRKLDRSLANEPICLNNLSHTTHTWADMNTSKKQQIWDELEKFQNRICVYCEARAEKGEFTGHIEHFFDKSSHIDKTFEWSNLFGCCSSTKHCGHYKDQVLPGGVKRQYNSNLLIKPDKEDPESFLKFRESGKISVRDDLDEHHQKRAEETIRALHLDESSLNDSRKQQISRFQEKVNAIMMILDSCDEKIFEETLEEYSKIKEDASTSYYRTALKQAVLWL